MYEKFGGDVCLCATAEKQSTRICYGILSCGYCGRSNKVLRVLVVTFFADAAAELGNSRIR